MVIRQITSAVFLNFHSHYPFQPQSVVLNPTPSAPLAPEATPTPAAPVIDAAPPVDAAPTVTLADTAAPPRKSVIGQRKPAGAKKGLATKKFGKA